jgi:hypothetical protein
MPGQTRENAKVDKGEHGTNEENTGRTRETVEWMKGAKDKYGRMWSGWKEHNGRRGGIFDRPFKSNVSRIR